MASGKFWKYSTRQFVFIYPKAWLSLQTAPFDSARVNCLAAIGHKSDTGRSVFIVYQAKVETSAQQAIDIVKQDPEKKIVSEGTLTIGSLSGPAVSWLLFENGVEYFGTAFYPSFGGRTFEILINTSEANDNRTALLNESDAILKSWEWDQSTPVAESLPVAPNGDGSAVPPLPSPTIAPVDICPSLYSERNAQIDEVNRQYNQLEQAIRQKLAARGLDVTNPAAYAQADTDRRSAIGRIEEAFRRECPDYQP